MKKGQNMSLNTIVIAAIVVLVLIVLSVIFIRNSGKFSENVGSCELQGGKCAANCGDVGAGTEDYTIKGADDLCESPEVCCLKIK